MKKIKARNLKIGDLIFFYSRRETLNPSWSLFLIVDCRQSDDNRGMITDLFIIINKTGGCLGKIIDDYFFGEDNENLIKIN